MTLESTAEIVELDGIPCRVWQGATGRGVPVTAFIPRVAVQRDRDGSEFEAELIETAEPRAVDPSGPWPARMVL